MEKTRFGFLGRFLYIKFFLHLRSKKHRAFLGAIPRTDVLIDCGCSSGLHSKGFEEKTSQLIGLDIVKSSLFEYRKRFGNRTSCILASLDYLPFQPNSIDACVLQDSLEHIKNPVDVLSQIKSTLKPKGTVVATVPNWYNRFLNVNPHNVITHHHFHSSLGWQKLFIKAGFYDCDVFCIGFPILNIEFLSKNFHFFGVTVMLNAHKIDRHFSEKILHTKGQLS
jgi:SAM-dependent methyltransferase